LKYLGGKKDILDTKNPKRLKYEPGNDLKGHVYEKDYI
jgi:hypothetical protein